MCCIQGRGHCSGADPERLADGHVVEVRVVAEEDGGPLPLRQARERHAQLGIPLRMVVCSGPLVKVDFRDASAHVRALAELQPEFDANWRRLSTTEQKALRAVIGGDGSPFGRRVLEQLAVPKSTIRAALRSLTANATVEQRGEDYVIVDPLFAEWIAGLREPGDEA